MKTSGHVDWLAVTFPASVIPNDTLPRSLCQSPWTLAGRGANGYRQRYVNQVGASLMMGAEERQGMHLVLTGDVLEQIRFDVPETEILRHVLEVGGKLTRLDVAVNIFDGELTPQEVALSFERGAIQTPARGGLWTQKVGLPDATFALGSRTSDRYLRCYNKAAEQGLSDLRWIRIELELKKRRANTLAAVLAASPNERAVINRAIGDFFKMPNNKELEEVLRDTAGPLPQESRKLTKTYQWLINQVAPAMARYAHEHPDEDIESAFLTAYALARSRFEGPEQPER